jgi:hypothetical protein
VSHHFDTPAPRPVPRIAVQTPAVRLAKLMARVSDTVLLSVIDNLAPADYEPTQDEAASIAMVLSELQERHPECEDAILGWVAAQPEDRGIGQDALARESARIYREAGIA